MPTKERIYNWYVCMVAAMCMVLYGYDASVFNAAQNSQNWLNWMNLDAKKDAYLLGLVNTAYTIGAIVAGWFLGGPIVSFAMSFLYYFTDLILLRLITLVAASAWAWVVL